MSLERRNINKWYFYDVFRVGGRLQHFYCCGGAEARYLAEERRRARLKRQAAQADLRRLKAAQKLGLKSIDPLTGSN